MANHPASAEQPGKEGMPKPSVRTSSLPVGPALTMYLYKWPTRSPVLLIDFGPNRLR